MPLTVWGGTKCSWQCVRRPSSFPTGSFSLQRTIFLVHPRQNHLVSGGGPAGWPSGPPVVFPHNYGSHEAAEIWELLIFYRRWHPGWGSWGCSPWPTDNDRGGGKVRSPAKPLKIRDHQQWRECFSGNDRSSPRHLPCHPWECSPLGFTHRRGGRNWWVHRWEDHSTGDHGQIGSATFVRMTPTVSSATPSLSPNDCTFWELHLAPSHLNSGALTFSYGHC